MEAFKDRYNKNTIAEMANEIAKHDSKFNSESFVENSIKNFSKMEMKERVVQIANNLNTHLEHSYKKQLHIILKTLKNKDGEGIEGFILWPYTYFIEINGLNDFKTSMNGLYEITKRFTSEFGVRPFLNRYPEETYTIFDKWAEDPNEHVRRWVSEGTRPNLPWGMNIDHLKEHNGKNFKKNLKLLEKLKDDPSKYVRTSVANHMNDITWTHPELVIKTLKKWSKVKTNEMDWIVKRALRNLLKQGNAEALSLMGYDANTKASVKKLKLSKTKIIEGDSFTLSLEIQNLETKKSSFMIDYNLYYPKANGKLSKKTFKLKSLELETNEKASISKKVSFKKVTTRQHYPGTHLIEVQVNGVVKGKKSFSFKFSEFI